jgi:hypothetical protein
MESDQDGISRGQPGTTGSESNAESIPSNVQRILSATVKGARDIGGQAQARVASVRSRIASAKEDLEGATEMRKIERESGRARREEEARQRRALMTRRVQTEILSRQARKAIRILYQIHKVLVESELALTAAFARPTGRAELRRAERAIQGYSNLVNRNRLNLPPDLLSHCDIIADELLSAHRHLRLKGRESVSLLRHSIELTLPSLRQHLETEVAELRKLSTDPAP